MNAAANSFAPPGPLDSALALLRRQAVVQRHILREGEHVWGVGDSAPVLHVVRFGSFKTLARLDAQRERVAALHWRGDWMGLETLGAAPAGSRVIAMEMSGVWSIVHESICSACLRCPPLLARIHAAMAGELQRQRDVWLLLRALPALARLAAFLRWRSAALGERGLRNDRILLRLTRFEIGDYLGLSVETVSRAFTRLAAGGLIRYVGTGRREIQIADDRGSVRPGRRTRRLTCVKKRRSCPRSRADYRSSPAGTNPVRRCLPCAGGAGASADAGPVQRTRYANPAVTQQFGYLHSELLAGFDPLELVAPEDREVLSVWSTRILHEGAPADLITLHDVSELQAALDGQPRTVLHRCVARSDGRGGVARVVSAGALLQHCGRAAKAGRLLRCANAGPQPAVRTTRHETAGLHLHRAIMTEHPCITRRRAAAFLSALALQPAHAAAPPGVTRDEARDVVARATGRTRWDGPASGPVAQPGKTIALLAEDLRNGGVVGVAQGVREAARAIGWTLRMHDAGGTAGGRAKALAEALATRPDGLVLCGSDAVESTAALAGFARRGVPVVGWHCGPGLGPVAATPVAMNVTTDPLQVARVTALAAVAQSDGSAGVVVFTDSRFRIATAKAEAMAALIRASRGCTLLELCDVPISECATRMAGVTAALLARHGKAWTHALAINDIYFDYAIPELVRAGLAGHELQMLSAGDGSSAAFLRIQARTFQCGTVAEPLVQQGWQLLDELNRLFAGEPVSGYVAPVHLVTADNIGQDVGERFQYDPDNGYRDAYRRIWKR